VTGIMPKGTVKFFKKTWGFITDESGQEIFVHFSQIIGEGFKKLKQGEIVEFELGESEKGPHAVNIRRIAK
jgi:CspA family cold shock protein